jgi:hypothetical protein
MNSDAQDQRDADNCSKLQYSNVFHIKIVLCLLLSIGAVRFCVCAVRFLDVIFSGSFSFWSGNVQCSNRFSVQVIHVYNFSAIVL